MVAPKLERLKAADVCQIAQVQPYVLRTWEAEFPDLGQPTASGPRIYGRADVERVLRIRELVTAGSPGGARRRLGNRRRSRPQRRRLRDGRRPDADADSERAAGLQSV
jgi:DNA-binding transcriptional MerR regulator